MFSLGSGAQDQGEPKLSPPRTA